MKYLLNIAIIITNFVITVVIIIINVSIVHAFHHC